MRILAVMIVLLAGPVSAGWEPPSIGSTVLLIGAEAMLAADAWQSMEIVRHPDQWRETNPLLGEHPSALRLWGTACAIGAGSALLWYALPPDLRHYVPAVMVVFEFPAVTHNAIVGMSMRF